MSRSLKDKFPDATVIGCSTSGEIVSGSMLKNSVVAMALESDVIAGIAADVIDVTDRKAPSRAIIGLAEKFGSKPLDLNPDQYVGIILIDGLSCAEEWLMEKIGDLVNIPIIGGSAGDDLSFKKTWVYLDGKAYNNAAILALMKPACKFDLIKTQSFIQANKKLTPTEVDEATRKVIEFNDMPAVTAYAKAVGVDEKDVASQFMTHPVGLIADGDPFVRSPQRVDGSSIYFYCQIRNGVDLEVLTSTDIIADTTDVVQKVQKEKGPIKGLINFNCILRTLQLEQEQKTDAYGNIFKNIPTIGFSTYGEEFIGHMNQTSTILIFL
ncbi:MAG: FIST C-terminal domain-containing protein [Methanospirillum sp.]|uniref:FIST signal transduction protein n=1 Tax=Methanospirillum sp. TaxID=45200 RepID=UPI00237536D3|nr:FIST N-terminal domain-containing protein [Methanospirillum sp.]MDD1727594.1 FIST C-terminal domain-containing protein [Methanospirillum sp.]